MILLADPRLDASRLLEGLLEGAGYRTTHAATPQAVLEILRQHDVDLLLVSEQLAAGEEDALVRSVLDHRPGLPILYITSSAVPDAMARAASRILRGPVQSAELLERLRYAFA